MAQLNVDTNVIAPQSIDVELVRADVMHTRHVFRVTFEIFLSFTSTLVGYLLALPTLLPFHWIVLLVFGSGTIGFLIMSARVGSKKAVTSTK